MTHRHEMLFRHAIPPSYPFRRVAVGRGRGGTLHVARAAPAVAPAAGEAASVFSP